MPLSPEQFFANLNSFGIRKEPRFEEPMIEDFVRIHDCAICGAKAPSTCSHIFSKGRSGNWASSLFTMPKCMDCHRDFTELSLEEFERKHAVDMRSLALLWAEKIARYLCDKIRELTGVEKPVTKKAKVKQAPAKDKIFRKLKMGKDGLERCTSCWLTSAPSDPVRHKESCKYNQ